MKNIYTANFFPSSPLARVAMRCSHVEMNDGHVASINLQIAIDTFVEMLNKTTIEETKEVKQFRVPTLDECSNATVSSSVEEDNLTDEEKKKLLFIVNSECNKQLDPLTALAVRACNIAVLQALRHANRRQYQNVNFWLNVRSLPIWEEMIQTAVVAFLEKLRPLAYIQMFGGERPTKVKKSVVSEFITNYTSKSVNAELVKTANGCYIGGMGVTAFWSVVNKVNHLPVVYARQMGNGKTAENVQLSSILDENGDHDENTVDATVNEMFASVEKKSIANSLVNKLNSSAAYSFSSTEIEVIRLWIVESLDNETISERVGRTVRTVQLAKRKFKEVYTNVTKELICSDSEKLQYFINHI